MSGAACEPAPCPYLRQAPTTTPAPVTGDIDRRTFTLQGVFAGGLAAVALASAGLAAGLGRLGGKSGPGSEVTGTPTSSPSTSDHRDHRGGIGIDVFPHDYAGRETGGVRVASASSVPVGGSTTFQDPRSGDPSIVVQPEAGTFAAFDAICPHEGCIVAFFPSQKKFICRATGRSTTGPRGRCYADHRPMVSGASR